MPVFAPGVPPYTIRPPLTTGDMGEPSDSIFLDARRVFDFMEDERHLTAHALLLQVQERIQRWETTHDPVPSTDSKTNQHKHHHKSHHRQRRQNASIKKEKERLKSTAEFIHQQQEVTQAKALFEANHVRLNKLENRCRLFRKALKNLEEQDEWTLASTLFGIQTFYRRESDGSLSLKLEGEVNDIPLFEQVCVLREVDLHYKWAPFCSSSLTVADLDKLDTVGWFMIGLSGFGLARDGCFRAIGCDNILEDGSIVLAGQGVQDLPDDAQLSPNSDTYLSNDPVIAQLPIPPKPTRRGADRMTIRTFDATIHVISPTSAKTKIVANIDPNIRFLPQSLLEFVMKQLAGVLLAKLQSAAKKVVKHPLTNEHARKMRRESDFYKSWLMAKFQAVCDYHGWEMPPVNAFSLNEDELLNESVNAANAVQQQDERRAKMFPTLSRRVSFAGLANETAPLTSTFTPRPRASTWHLGNDEDDQYGRDKSEHSRQNDDNRSDCVSELSVMSERSWYHRPVRSFLQKREEKRIARKLAEVKAIRQQAAQRYMPKPLSPSQQQRLDQLREARVHRLGGGTSMTMLSSPTSQSRPVGADTARVDQMNGSPGPHVADILSMEDSRSGASDGMSVLSETGLAAKRGTSGGVRRRRRKSWSEQITDRLQTHSRVRRFWVISLVMTLLFLMLNPELWELLISPNHGILPWTRRPRNRTTTKNAVETSNSLKSNHDIQLRQQDHSLPEGGRPEKTDSTDIQSNMEAYHSLAVETLSVFCWWVQGFMVNGAGLLLYLCLCTILHYFACDIALVYAFNALDLGSKTGRQAKKYYNDNVRLVVAGMSAGFCLLSVTKALAQVALSAAVWVAYNPQAVMKLGKEWFVTPVFRPLTRLWLGNNNSLGNVMLGDTNVPEWMQSALNNVTEAFDSDFDDSLTRIGGWKDAVFNWSLASLGRTLEPFWDRTSWLVNFFPSIISGPIVVDLDTALDSWQANAFATARTLFSYSSVPLLIFLVLFIHSARWARPSDDTISSSSTMSPPAQTPHNHKQRNGTLNTIPEVATADKESTSNIDNNNTKDAKEKNTNRMPSPPTPPSNGSPRRPYRHHMSAPDPHEQERQARHRKQFLGWSPHSQTDLEVVHEFDERNE